MSPALVISILALVVAAIGTPFASAAVGFIAKAVGLNSTQKKQVVKIADTEIKKKAGGLSVKSAKSATSAKTATDATNATNATNATHATTATNATTATTANGLSSSAASAFLSAGRVVSVNKTLSNTTAPTPIGTIGPFTITADCSVTAGTLTADFTLGYPAGSVINEGQKTAAGTQSLDSWSTTSTTFSADASTEGDIGVPLTLIAPDGTPYQLLEGWDAINYPTAGSCRFQLLAVQG